MPSNCRLSYATLSPQDKCLQNALEDRQRARGHREGASLASGRGDRKRGRRRGQRRARCPPRRGTARHPRRKRRRESGGRRGHRSDDAKNDARRRHRRRRRCPGSRATSRRPRTCAHRAAPRSCLQQHRSRPLATGSAPTEDSLEACRRTKMRESRNLRILQIQKRAKGRPAAYEESRGAGGSNTSAPCACSPSGNTPCARALHAGAPARRCLDAQFWTAPLGAAHCRAIAAATGCTLPAPSGPRAATGARASRARAAASGGPGCRLRAGCRAQRVRLARGRMVVGRARLCVPRPR